MPPKKKHTTVEAKLAAERAKKLAWYHRYAYLWLVSSSLTDCPASSQGIASVNSSSCASGTRSRRSRMAGNAECKRRQHHHHGMLQHCVACHPDSYIPQGFRRGALQIFGAPRSRYFCRAALHNQQRPRWIHSRDDRRSPQTGIYQWMLLPRGEGVCPRPA